MIIPLPGTSHSETVTIYGRTCPVCGHDHSVFMRRKHIFILFLFFGAHSETTSGPVCTRCLRRQIFERAWIEMLTANVLWPFFFCLSEIPQLVFSLVKEVGVRYGKVSPMDMAGDVWKRNWLFAFSGTVFAALCGIGLLVFAGFLLSFVKAPCQFWASVLTLWFILFLVGTFLHRKSRMAGNCR